MEQYDHLLLALRDPDTTDLEIADMIEEMDALTVVAVIRELVRALRLLAKMGFVVHS